MNESDPKLLEGLRALAADGPREASAPMEEGLLREMRRRSQARRRNRWLVGAAAVAAAIILAIWMRPAPSRPAPVQAHVEKPPVVTPVIKEPAPEPVKPAAARSSHRHGAEVAVFYRLPDIDQLAPLESARIVRVELPVSSLRLMGFQVSEDPASSAIQADVLLGQDGLARAVRFVQ